MRAPHNGLLVPLSIKNSERRFYRCTIRAWVSTRVQPFKILPQRMISRDLSIREKHMVMSRFTGAWWPCCQKENMEWKLWRFSGISTVESAILICIPLVISGHPQTRRSASPEKWGRNTTVGQRADSHKFAEQWTYFFPAQISAAILINVKRKWMSSRLARDVTWNGRSHLTSWIKDKSCTWYMWKFERNHLFHCSWTHEGKTPEILQTSVPTNLDESTDERRKRRLTWDSWFISVWTQVTVCR
jgi:hypothetical protein